MAKVNLPDFSIYFQYTSLQYPGSVPLGYRFGQWACKKFWKLQHALITVN